MPINSINSYIGYKNSLSPSFKATYKNGQEYETSSKGGKTALIAGLALGSFEAVRKVGFNSNFSVMKLFKKFLPVFLGAMTAGAIYDVAVTAKRIQKARLADPIDEKEKFKNALTSDKYVKRYNPIEQSIEISRKQLPNRFSSFEIYADGTVFSKNKVTGNSTVEFHSEEMKDLYKLYTTKEFYKDLKDKKYNKEYIKERDCISVWRPAEGHMGYVMFPSYEIYRNGTVRPVSGAKFLSEPVLQENAMMKKYFDSNSYENKQAEKFYECLNNPEYTKVFDSDSRKLIVSKPNMKDGLTYVIDGRGGVTKSDGWTGDEKIIEKNYDLTKLWTSLYEHKNNPAIKEDPVF